MVFYQDPPSDEGEESPWAAFVRGFAFGGPPPAEPPAKTDVGIADLREYLRQQRYASYAAYRIWDIVLNRLVLALAEPPINLDVAIHYATDEKEFTEARLEIADLKKMVEHLRQQMVSGYLPLMHRVLCAWIASL